MFVNVKRWCNIGYIFPYVVNGELHYNNVFIRKSEMSSSFSNLKALFYSKVNL